MLQWVAVGCSLLQCSNIKGIPVVKLKYTEGICECESQSLTTGMCACLQCVAVCCSVLQRVAVCCSVLQCAMCGCLLCVAVCCSVCCCSLLQCVAVFKLQGHFCSVPQRHYGVATVSRLLKTIGLFSRISSV